MVDTSVFCFFIFFLNLQQIQSVDNHNLSNGAKNDLQINTTSGLFQGKKVIVHNVSIQQFFGIPYGEKPLRFQMPVLRQYNTKAIIYAINRTPACHQISGGLSYGPFQLSDMFDEDCLTLNMFIPKSRSSAPKAIMVFCHGGSNQIGSASLFDGSAIAAIGDIIVITINYRLNVFGFLTPDTNMMSGNYGLHDQLLALKWISLNAKYFNGDSKRITYVGHSTGAVNALLLAMSKRSDGLIARVIAQSGCPLNRWAIDRQPKVRFDNVMKRNNMNKGKKYMQSNIDRLKTMSERDFHYLYHHRFETSPDYPFPVVDNDLVTDDLEQLIRTGPLSNTDILIGVTADESLYTVEDHMFNRYLPKKYRVDPTQSIQSTSEDTQISSRISTVEHEQMRGFSYFKKNKYIKKYLQANHPEYLCFIDEIQARYTLKSNQRQNITEIARLYTNLVSDLTIYYDLVRFLHQRLRSESSASTYVYYYTYPPIFNHGSLRRHVPNMVGHFAELDLVWGASFLNRTNSSTTSLSYTSEETELSLQMIRYWTNFVKTGNPNEPDQVSVHWPSYEKSKKSYINFHAQRIRIDENFLEEPFQFWDMTSHRQLCIPFYWYHTCLLVGILILTLLLIIIYIFHSTKRSRRNIKPTELTTRNIITTYHFLPTVIS